MDRRPYLTLGVAYPDVTLFESGEGESVLLWAGFFGNDWSFERGEFVWTETR